MTEIGELRGAASRKRAFLQVFSLLAVSLEPGAVLHRVHASARNWDRVPVVREQVV